MTLPLRAVLLDIRTYLAENNIRRNTSAFSINYSSASEDVSMSSFSLGPTLVKDIVSQLNPCTVTVLRTSIPLTVQVTVRSSDPLLIPPTVFTVTVSKLLVLDSDVESLTVTNPSATETAKVSLQQG